MKLVYIFAAILAVAIAETNDEKYEDLLALESIELKKESSDLSPAASAYNYVPPSQRPPQWGQPGSVPPLTWTQSKPDPPPPVHIPSAPANPPYAPPVTASPPYVPPVQSDYVPPQNNYYPVNTWVPPHHTHPPTTTTPIPVIKNEQQFWDNGAYRYEYQIADGTWVGEEGYYTDPKGTEESLVKKGWYSYVGADGKTYTVTYYADHTGFHAYGNHLPTPPPVPAAIQAALDKEEAQKNQQPITIAPIYHPTYPTYRPPVQTYPQQPVYGK